VKALRYRIRLVEPALLTGIEGNPNDGVSLDYLPGSVLRGAIMRKYRQQHGPLDAANDQIRRLFLENSTRFLNGYLVNTADDPALCRRGLPLPLSFQREKGTKEPLYDFSVKEPSEGPWQSVSTPFGILTEDHQGKPIIYPLQPKRQLKVHNQRLDRDAGRPTERAGEVYRYESLAADQTFEAVILCDRETDTALLKPLLQGEILLGGARSGGYGRAFFQAITEEMAWREIGGKLITGAVNDGFTVTLLSDALVRDSWGQFVASAEAIKVALEQRWRLAPNSLLCEGERSFWRGQINGGFNRRWGLPLPQALAIKMGSVFAFSLSAGCQCTTDQLNTLEAEGIGERRAEGFGRVAVNWHAEYEKWTLSKASVTQPGTRLLNLWLLAGKFFMLLLCLAFLI
jgi:CRISPR-associated protein Csx10